MTIGPSDFPWAAAIAKRASASGLELSDRSAEALAAHARAVLAANEWLHLTSVTDPPAFVERHFGEAFEGAAMIPVSASGLLVDLGSGNGFPGIPIAVVRPGLNPILVEASAKKSGFLRDALAVAGCARGAVLEKHVVRAADLKGLESIAVLTTRAMGGWERIVPKLATCLAPNGVVMVWGTIEAEALTGRVAWEKLRIVAKRSLPGRDRAIIYVFQRAVVS